MSLKTKQFYEFGEFRFEPEDYRLLHRGQEKKLDPKEMELLRLLLESRGSLVGKDDLLSALYPDERIPEAHDGSLHAFVSNIRDALGDTEKTLIENVRSKGYRFNGEVRIRRDHHSRVLLWTCVGTAVVLGTALVLTTSLRHTGDCRDGFKGVSTEARQLYLSADTYEALGEDEKALDAIQQALAIQPNFAEAEVRAAYLANDIDKHQLAATYLDQAQRLTSSRSAAFGLQVSALAAELKDNDEKALQMYQLLVDACPKNTKCLYRFAAIALDRGEYAEAVAALNRCLKLEPSNPFCQYFSILSDVQANHFRQALARAETLRKSGSVYPWIDELVGISLWGEGKIEEATSKFQSLAVGDRLHGVSYFVAGKEWSADLLLSQGKIREATKRIQELDDEADSDVQAAGATELASVYSLVGDYETSEFYLRRVPRDTKDPRLLRSAAETAAIIGDHSETSEFLMRRSSTGADPLDIATQHFISGALAISNSASRDDGIEQLKMAHELQPFDLETAYVLARAYAAKGDCASAAPLFDRVISSKGAVFVNDAPEMFALSYYGLAKCQDLVGQQDQARIQFKNFLALWSDADPDLVVVVDARKKLQHVENGRAKSETRTTRS